MSMSAEKIDTISACFGTYPQTQALKSGQIKSDRVALKLTEINPVYRAFGMMVREQKFDICEMAIVSYLQGKAYGKPMVLMPATMVGRFQHGTMLYNSARGTVTPYDLAGRRIGVRSFAQTTGCWLRGILWKDYGLDNSKVKWVTFEDAHVPEFKDPPGVERAPEGKDMTKMLLDGELDAAIFGTVPINHMVVVKTSVSKSDPGAVCEVFRMLHESKKAAGLPKPGVVDTLPFGFDAVKPALDLMSSYALEMKIIPRRYSVEELFDDTTRALQG